MIRRMLDRDTIYEKDFLNLSSGSKALYMYLLVNTDDDGIVDAYSVVKMLDPAPIDFEQLIEKNYLLPIIGDKGIFFLLKWHQGNDIKEIYKVDSKYKHLLIEKLKTLGTEGEKIITSLVTPSKKKNRNLYLDYDYEEKNLLLEECKEECSHKEENLQLFDEIEENKNKYNKNNHHLPKNVNEELNINEIVNTYGRFNNLELSKEEYERLEKIYISFNKLIDEASECKFDYNEDEEISDFRFIEIIADLKGYEKKINEYIFGTEKNLKLTQFEYSFLSKKYVEIDKHLDDVADKILGKEIKNILNYIQKIAINENWKLISDLEVKKVKRMLNKAQLNRSYGREERIEERIEEKINNDNNEVSAIQKEIDKKLEEMRKGRKSRE